MKNINPFITMTFFKIITLFACVVMVTSCNLEVDDRPNNIKRESVIGEWKLTRESMKKLKSDKNLSEKQLRKFQLNRDSSAVVFFTDSDKGTTTDWYWKKGKKIGNRMLSIGVAFDILITERKTSTSFSFLGLQIATDDDKIVLMANNEMEYERL